MGWETADGNGPWKRLGGEKRPTMYVQSGIRHQKNPGCHTHARDAAGRA